MTPTLSPSEREKRLAEIEAKYRDIHDPGEFEMYCFAIIPELLSFARQPLPFWLPLHGPEEAPPDRGHAEMLLVAVPIGDTGRFAIDTLTGFPRDRFMNNARAFMAIGSLAWQRIIWWAYADDFAKASVHQFLNQQGDKTDA